ncbi:MAG: Na(+)/H(+) antiporter subunit B [Thermoprotei archaeon]
MMDYVDLVFLTMGLLALSSVLFTFLTVRTKDLMYAVIYSSVQSVAYALIYFLLLAPDIVLVYVAVAVGIYPLVIILLIKKVGRYEVRV